MRMTASWSGPTNLPNTSLRRDIRAQWRAPLGSIRRHLTGASQAGTSQRCPSRCSSSLRVLSRAVRGNSGITETQLILGVLTLWAAWVDGRGFVDRAEMAAFEEAQGDQIGKAQDRDLDAVAAGGDAQQRVGDHRGKDLEADGVVVVAEE